MADMVAKTEALRPGTLEHSHDFNPNEPLKDALERANAVNDLQNKLQEKDKEIDKLQGEVTSLRNDKYKDQISRRKLGKAALAIMGGFGLGGGIYASREALSGGVVSTPRTISEKHDQVASSSETDEENRDIVTSMGNVTQDGWLFVYNPSEFEANLGTVDASMEMGLNTPNVTLENPSLVILNSSNGDLTSDDSLNVIDINRGDRAALIGIPTKPNDLTYFSFQVTDAGGNVSESGNIKRILNTVDYPSYVGGDERVFVEPEDVNSINAGKLSDLDRDIRKWDNIGMHISLAFPLNPFVGGITKKTNDKTEHIITLSQDVLKDPLGNGAEIAADIKAARILMGGLRDTDVYNPELVDMMADQIDVIKKFKPLYENTVQGLDENVNLGRGVNPQEVKRGFEGFDQENIYSLGTYDPNIDMTEGMKTADRFKSVDDVFVSGLNVFIHYPNEFLARYRVLDPKQQSLATPIANAILSLTKYASKAKGGDAQAAAIKGLIPSYKLLESEFSVGQNALLNPTE